MAIDPINWRREMKKFIGAELAALKNENSQLRAEVHALRNDIAQIYATLNSIEELTRLLTANSMMTNLEQKMPMSNNSTDTLPNENVTDKIKSHTPTLKLSKKTTPVHSNNNFSQATTTVENKTGIHARPASVFVQTASKFKSKVQLSAKGKTVDAKSILMIMSMGLTRGTEVTIKAQGYDSRDAVKALINLIDDKFGEE